MYNSLIGLGVREFNELDGFVDTGKLNYGP